MSKKRTRAANGAGKRSGNPLARKVSDREAVWLEGPVPTGYWLSPDNQRLYLIWLGQRLGYRKLEDYYRIRTSDFKKNRGSGALLHCWGSSAVTAVMETFADQSWHEWLFVSCPRSFWADRKNHRRYMKWLADQCGINEPDDWYGITNRDFRSHKRRSVPSPLRQHNLRGREGVSAETKLERVAVWKDSERLLGSSGQPAAIHEVAGQTAGL